MKAFLYIIFIICAQFSQAKEDPRYPINAIPEELKKGSHAVVREDQLIFTILSKSTAAMKVKMVVSIFNDNGKHFAQRAVHYDKLRKITTLKAQVLDADGFVIKKLKGNEITDHSAFDGFYDDSRVKIADLRQGNYPYTVEFEYEVAYKFLFDISGSYINPYENVSVEKAHYQLIFPEHLRPRYKTYNVLKEPKEEKANGVISLEWSFSNIKGAKFEQYSDYLKSVIRIDAAPNEFEFEGYAGTMKSWNDYGKWIASINKGRDALPEESKRKIAAITAGLPSVEQKVKALYEYMQNKTRYVSIQLGIGGYQPFEASVVDKTGYGDCKALSNYMLAMLETIGIEGYYALIMAGDKAPELQSDFPSSQFNHAIVAVPNGADTLWLECTSQTNPFGYQGLHTGDRKALLITDNGAAIVNTTRYSAEVNLQSTLADVKLGRAGEAEAHVKRTYQGLQYENDNLNFLITGQHDEQKKWLQKHLDIASFDIASFSMKNIKDKIPSAIVNAKLTMNRFATVSGKRIFLTPNLMNRQTFIPEKNENRKSEIVKRIGFTDVDTIKYELPEGIYPEFVPPDVKVESIFGEYEARYEIEAGHLMYTRRLKMNKGRFPASTYPQMAEFYRNINKADNVKIVFMTKT